METGRFRRLRDWLAGTRRTWRGLRILWEIDPRRTAYLLCIETIQASLGPAGVWLGKVVIDELVRASGQAGQAGGSPPAPVFLFALAFVGVTILADALAPLAHMQSGLLGERFRTGIDELLMRKANTFPDLGPFEDAGFHARTRVARADRYFGIMWMGILFHAYGGTLTIVAAAGLLLPVAPWLPLPLLALAIPKLLSEIRLEQAAHEGRPEIQELRRRAEYLLDVPLGMQSIHEVKAFGLTPFFAERYRRVTDRLLRLLRGDLRRWTRHGLMWGMLEALVIGGVFAWMVRRALAGGITPGQLALLVGAVLQLNAGVRELFGIFSIGAREGVNLKRILDFLDSESTMAVPAPGVRVVPERAFESGFVFQGVRFSYDGEKPVLDIPHLVIPAGRVTALVGENGAGKSTLVKLLLRLYDPNEGRILLNGIPLEEYDLTSLRDVASGVFQDFVRYELTFRENIAVGDVRAWSDDGRVRHAASRTGAASVAERLAHGYETQLGRMFGGQELSGGEWQRVAIARAFMRQAQTKLLILDEPTAALDARIEHEIFSKMVALSRGRTVILVLHRFSTVRLADKIVFLDQGRVLEEGDHESLIRLGGRYAELYRMQAERYR